MSASGPSETCCEQADGVQQTVVSFQEQRRWYTVTVDRPRGGPYQSANLLDILDRVLDKGLVVAGDIRISLANVELLTVKIRLLVCSIDKAEQIGLNWWRHDRELVQPSESTETATIAVLEQRVAELERQLTRGTVSEQAPLPSQHREER
jgi:gas vesicle protein GvpA/GvpJ/GvpM family